MNDLPASNLLQEICLLGERLCDALEADDLDCFFTLMLERAALLERLQAFDHPSEVDPDWERTAERLSAQHKVLSEALEAQQRRMDDALASLHQLKGARRSYTSLPPPPRFLRDDLQG